LKEAIAKHGPPEIMNTDSHTIGASSRMVWLKHWSTVRWVGAAWRTGVIWLSLRSTRRVFPWTCRSSGSALRRACLKDAAVTQEGPDHLVSW